MITLHPGNIRSVEQINLGPKMKLSSLNFISKAWKVKRVLNKIKPDLIHAHYVFNNGWYGAISGFHPFVITVWGSDILAGAGAFDRLFAFTLTRMALNKADLITAHSQFLQDALFKIGNYTQKIRRISWGVDLSSFQPGLTTESLRKRLKINSSPVVLSIRCMRPLYNIDVILRAIPLVKQKIPNVKFVFTEYQKDRKYKYALENLVATLKIADSVIFVGTVEYNEIPLYLNMADIFVSIPSSDGLPISLLEAMVCGTPVILSDLPQYKEVIKDQENGLIVPLRNEKALAEAIIKLLKDENLRERLRDRNLEIVSTQEGYDYFKEMGKMERIYYDLVS